MNLFFFLQVTPEKQWVLGGGRQEETGCVSCATARLPSGLGAAQGTGRTSYGVPSVVEPPPQLAALAGTHGSP